MHPVGAFIRRVLTPPTLDAGGRTDAAWTLHWAVWSFGGTAIPLIVLMIWLFPVNAERYVFQGLMITVIAGVALVFNHRGHTRLAGSWIVTTLWGFLTVAAWTSGGLSSPAATGYLAVVALSGLLLGVGAGMTTAVVSIIVYVVLAYAQNIGVLPASELTHTPLSRAFDLTTFTVILAAVQALLLASLSRSRANTEQELAVRRSAEKRLDDLVNSAPFGSFAFELTPNDDLVLVATNRPALDILGLHDDTLIGMAIDEAFPAMTPGVTEAFKRVAREGTVFEVDYFRYDDERISGDFEMHAFQTGADHVAVFFRDVSEKHRAALALQHMTEELNNFFNVTLDLLVITDMDGRIIRANTAWERTLGYSIDELTGRHVYDLIHPDDAAKTDEAMRALAQDIAVSGFVNRYLHADGTYRWLEWRSAPHDGWVYAAARDITADIAAEEQIRRLNSELESRVSERTHELEAAVAELEKATRAKDEFLASMSHELRTPLNSIIGFAGVLQSGFAGPLNDEQRRQIHMIGSSGQRLLGLVSQVLDLSRLEEEDLEANFEEFDIAEVARHAVYVISPIAFDKHIELRSEIPARAIPIRSDRGRIDQILLNLLGNATKFVQQGWVLLSVYPGEGHVTIAVEDSGPGISAEHLPRIFDRFYQVPPEHGGKHEGSGLGLSVTRQLAESLGGTVSVESTPGKGSLFRVQLPSGVPD